MILSPAQGKEWKYDFAQLLEGLGGSYFLFSTWKGWIQRPDAISAVLDEWQCETVEGRESTVKYWGHGWWYHIEGKNGNKVDAARENQESITEKSGTWRKFNFVENSKPERYLKEFQNIEVGFPRSSMPLEVWLIGVHWGIENVPFQRSAGALSAISRAPPPNYVGGDLSGNGEGLC